MIHLLKTGARHIHAVFKQFSGWQENKGHANRAAHQYKAMQTFLKKQEKKTSQNTQKAKLEYDKHTQTSHEKQGRAGFPKRLQTKTTWSLRFGFFFFQGGNVGWGGR